MNSAGILTHIFLILKAMVAQIHWFWRNFHTGCPKKTSVTDFSNFLDWKHDHQPTIWPFIALGDTLTISWVFWILWQVLTLSNTSLILFGVFEKEQMTQTMAILCIRLWISSIKLRQYLERRVNYNYVLYKNIDI